MVEIMVPFSHSKNSGQKMVAGSMLVIVRRGSEIVSNGVDAKSALNSGQVFVSDSEKHRTHVMTRSHTKCANEKETALPVSPQQAGNDHWKQVPENSQDDKVPSVLPLYERVLAQVRDISWPRFQV
jgi:hypothetical protein